MDKPYVGTVGFLIEADCKQDIASATNYSFRIRKPAGDEVVRGISDGVTLFEIDGVVRGVKYATKEGDFSEPGQYKIHLFLTLGNWSGPGEVGVLTVRPLFS